MEKTNKKVLHKLREEIDEKFCIVDEYKDEFEKINHVLIVDDDEVSNFATRKTLECYNMVNKTTVFDNPKDALDFLNTSNNNPDIILLDIKMPDMNGFEFIEEFNKLKCNSVIIILSSSVYSKDQDRAKDNGIKYMAKPLKVNVLQTYL